MSFTPAERNQRAIAGLKDLASLMDQDNAKLAPPGGRRLFAIGWGLMTALHRQACAVILLHGKGLAHEAAPNRRLMIECMAQLHWLVRDREVAADSMNKAFQQAQKKLREAVDEGKVFSYSEEDAAAADAVAAMTLPSHANDRLNQAGNLLKDLGHGLKEAWLIETRRSHAGLAAAQFFFDSSSASELILYDSPHMEGVPADDELSPLMACGMVYYGAEAFNDLLEGSPWTRDLERIGVNTGLIKSAEEELGFSGS
ncbi:DUF5677 domain-containing protein [Kitasatospora sp. NPDC001261]|uniref:DUF5677 domain-containing protein n=1 Tax=Kitasatospora sp. NPDC001261 TaxID=3364012 RepID=UPI003682C43E